MLALQKKKGNPLMLLKVDFEKTYDLVSWDFLDYMLGRMGFSNKWRSWIRACLISASVSILVNGSPTKEFSVSKGLCQGDPMAPFLFLIVAEGLDGLIKKAVSLGLYEPYVINNNWEEVAVSHVQYADDTIMRNLLSFNLSLLGKWRWKLLTEGEGLGAGLLR